MYTVAITLLNGHSVNVPSHDDKSKNDLIEMILRGPVVTVYLKSGEEVHIITDKVSYITVYKEEHK